jgi:hypothetical protein
MTGQVFFGFDKYQFEGVSPLPPQAAEIYDGFSTLFRLVIPVRQAIALVAVRAQKLLGETV